MTLMRSLLFLPILCAMAFGPGTGRTQGYELSDIIELRLLEGWRRDDGVHVSALQIKLAPGWKTYWRSPGEGGIPTVIELDAGPVTMHWPQPEVVYAGGMRSIVYTDQVILPFEVAVAGGPQEVRARVFMGLCQDICMPAEFELSAVWDTGDRPDPRIVAALADQPLTAAEAGAGEVRCRIRPIADGLRVQAALPLPGSEDDAVVIELPDPSVWISEPVAVRQGGTLLAEADLVPSHAGPFALDRSHLRFTVLNGTRVVEIIGCVAG